MAMMQNQYVRSDFFTRNLSSQLLHLKGFINFMNWFNMLVQMFFWRKICIAIITLECFLFFMLIQRLFLRKAFFNFGLPLILLGNLFCLERLQKYFGPKCTVVAYAAAGGAKCDPQKWIWNTWWTTSRWVNFTGDLHWKKGVDILVCTYSTYSRNNRLSSTIAHTYRKQKFQLSLKM